MTPLDTLLLYIIYVKIRKIEKIYFGLSHKTNKTQQKTEVESRHGASRLRQEETRLWSNKTETRREFGIPRF